MLKRLLLWIRGQSADVLRRGGLLIVGTAGLLATGYLVLQLSPDWFATSEGLDPKEVSDARQGVRTATLALLAGAVALIGAIYTGRTFWLNRQGQITERFSRAVEHLGNSEMDVRLGGIYALERIARESKVDHPPIMEVLTAYVRHRSPCAEEVPADAEQLPAAIAHVGATAVEVGKDMSWPSADRNAAAIDIGAVMAVLARRELRHERRPARFRLSKTNLRGIEAPGIDLRGSVLAHAHLQAADLTGARLESADFWGARLDRAHLASARLDSATMAHVRLDGATLTGARLAGSDLASAQLRGADLGEAQMQNAYLVGANLEDAHLVGSRLDAADLSQAQMQRANLRGAHLDGAILRGAILVDANLARVRLLDAVYDSSTRWPDGFDVEGSGARFESSKVT